MIQLPRELYGEIVKHLPLSEQSRYHQVSKMFREIPINAEDCCVEPSDLEIAKWIFEQSRLLSNENTKKYSVIPNNFIPTPIPGGDIVRFEWKNYTIFLDPNNGKLNLNWEGDDITPNTVNDILQYIRGKEFRLSFPNYMKRYPEKNWLLVRGVFSKRASCVKQGISGDECFLQLFNKWAVYDIGYNNTEDTYVLLRNIRSFLNDHAQEELEKAFSQAFSVPRMPFQGFVIPRDFLNSSMMNIDLKKVKLWLKQWVSQLTPNDLTPYP